MLRASVVNTMPCEPDASYDIHLADQMTGVSKQLSNVQGENEENTTPTETPQFTVCLEWTGNDKRRCLQFAGIKDSSNDEMKTDGSKRTSPLFAHNENSKLQKSKAKTSVTSVGHR